MSMLNSSLHDRCFEALSASRVGFHFPGHFLGIRWLGVEPGSSSLVMPSERRFQDERGRTDVTALAVLADTALSTVVRSFTSSVERLGTTQLQLQFTGAPERRSDMLLSTLRRYVEAMGGKLELVAKFPDRPRTVIDHLATPKERMGGFKYEVQRVDGDA